MVLSAGGAAGAPVVVRGARADGSPMRALIDGNRARPWAAGRTTSQEVFRLGTGASHVRFEDLDFTDIGNGAFRVAGVVADVTLRRMSADNVGRFLQSYRSGTAKEASVTGLLVEQVSVTAFAQGAVMLRDNTSDVVLRDIRGDSQGVLGDFPIGVHLVDRVHHVLLERVSMDNAVTPAGTGYWNGDGFAAEKSTHHLTYRQTSASGNADAGYDLKASDVVLDRASAAGNSRNFRVWGSRVTGTDVRSTSPVTRGGNASLHHLWVAGGAGPLALHRGTFTDADEELTGVYVQARASVELWDSRWLTPTGGPTEYVEPGASLRHLTSDGSGAPYLRPVVSVGDGPLAPARTRSVSYAAVSS